MTVSWNVAVCSTAEIDQRFGGACSLHYEALIMEAVSTSETSVSFYQMCAEQCPTRQFQVSKIIYFCDG
jgi:hypothetical protein